MPVPPPPAPPTGIGAARGIRWRGELDGLSPGLPRDHAGSVSDQAKQEQDLLPADRVTREAPAWLVSLVFHLILLLALALISTPAGSSLGKVMLSIGQSERESPVELVEFSVGDSTVESDGEMLTEMEPETVALFDEAQLSEVETVLPVEVGAGAEIAIEKPMFDGRSGAMKQTLMALYGGTTETEEAVELGLNWLSRQQHRRGYWSLLGGYSDGGISENKTAATAMALLAFMGNGNTHTAGPYAENVAKGMKYLVDNQDRSGAFERGSRRDSNMYAQAQATIAICELYAMTKNSWLRQKAELAIDFATKTQSSQGGWRYDPSIDDADTSVTGWFVMAIKSAEAAGLEVDRYLMLKVEDFLDSVQSFEGAAYAYQKFRDPSPSMTAEGLLCRQYSGWNRDHPSLGRGIEALLIDSPFDIDDQDVYYWYYATQVMHHYGGQPWRQWNRAMSVQLPAAQIKQGRERGSWAPQSDRWGSSAGRLYTTCLSIYCLEVYYRHMPLYQAVNE
jgi:hypothetical protein